MNYATSKQKAFSHRAVLVTAIAAVLSITTAATALSFDEEQKAQLYKLNATVKPHANATTVHIDIIEIASGKVVKSLNVTTQAGVPAEIRTTLGDRDCGVRIDVGADATASIRFTLSENGEVVQRTFYTSKSEPSKFTAEPISLNLKDADLKDVLRTFGQITGLEVVMSDAVEGKKVTLDVQDMPWDEVLSKIAAEDGLTIRVEGKKIIVER